MSVGPRKSDIPVKKFSGKGAPLLPERNEHQLYIEQKDRLRHCCIYGDHEQISMVLKNNANPCVADEFGVTPMMLAAWNGHLECVKFLVANDMGIAADRTKRKSMNLQTIKGLTVLHMFCQDALPWADEILFWLLLGGADTTILDQEGKTPLDYARENGKEQFLEMIKSFQAVEAGRDQEGDAAFRRRISDAKDELERLYAYHFDALDVVMELNVKFPVPKFVYQEERVGSLPKGMKIHEHHIKPLTEAGFSEMDTLTEGLHCLEFSKEQSEINAKRRQDLVKLQDPDWKVPEKPPILPRRSKNKRKEKIVIQGEANTEASTKKQDA